MESSAHAGRFRDRWQPAKGDSMAPLSRQNPHPDRAARSRDEALVRIRRATVAMGVSAAAAVIGIGGVIAVQAQQHAVASTAGTSGTPATTSGASAVATGSAAAVAPSVVASAPVAATTSGQS